MNITSQAVIEALETLQRTYPHEPRVSIWTEFYPQRGYQFTAIVGECQDCEYGHGLTLEQATRDVITKAGERDPQKRLKAKIDKAREELAKLEAQLEPVVVTPTAQEMNAKEAIQALDAMQPTTEQPQPVN